MQKFPACKYLKQRALQLEARRLTLIALFPLIFTTSHIAWAQSNSNVPESVKDPIAIQRLNLALTAVGGVQNASRMDSCIEEATRTANGKSVSVKRFNSGDDYRYETTLNGTTVVKTSRHTHKKNTNSSVAPRTKETVLVRESVGKTLPAIPSAMPVVPHLAPATLLRRMLDSKTSLEMLPASDSPSGTYGILMKKPSSVTKLTEEQRWYFDSKTNLPVSVSYWLPTITALQSHVVLHVDLENFGTVGGFTIPQRVTTSISSMTLGVESVRSLQCQQTLTSDLFTSEVAK